MSARAWVKCAALANLSEMKNVSLIRLMGVLLCGIALGGCAGVGDPKKDRRMEGRWKSNRALTVATFQYGKLTSEAERRKIESLFGQMILTYDGKELLAEVPATNGGKAWQTRMAYRVITSEWDSLSYVTKDLLLDAPKVTQVHFVGRDRYWIELGQKGWREYFDRIGGVPKKSGSR